jgi:hypothetical protein
MQRLFPQNVSGDIQGTIQEFQGTLGKKQSKIMIPAGGRGGGAVGG